MNLYLFFLNFCSERNLEQVKVMINFFLLKFHFPSFLKSDQEITRPDIIIMKYSCVRKDVFHCVAKSQLSGINIE